jgi:hypothetical protein
MYGESMMSGGSEDFEGSSIGSVWDSKSGEGDGNGDDSMGICGVRDMSDGDFENRETS